MKNILNRKRMAFFPIIVLLVIITGLYTTYAIDSGTLEEPTGDYDVYSTFNLANSTTKNVSVASGKTKVFDIGITNPYDDVVQYGVAYTLVNPTKLPNEVQILESWSSKNATVGTIEGNTNLSVSIMVINNSLSDVNLSFSIVNGYKNGGELLTDKMLVTEKYEMHDITLISGSGNSITGGKVITNLLVNASFENEGWSTDDYVKYSTEYKKYGNYSLELIGDEDNNIKSSISTEKITLDNMHIYYGRAEVYRKDSQPGDFEIYWPTLENSFGNLEFDHVDSWKIYSFVKEINDFEIDNYQLKINFDNKNNIYTVYYDGGMLLDLTSTFGEGNEPSKEWLDNNIGFFEGDASFKTEKVGNNLPVVYEVNLKPGYSIKSVTCNNNQLAVVSGKFVTINNVTADSSCVVNY